MKFLKFKNLAFLGSYLKPFRFQILIMILSITVVSGSILGLGYALEYLIDQGFVDHNSSNLNNSFIFLIVMVFLLSIASYNRSLRINLICEKLESNMKRDAYNNIINISPSYLELKKTSDILSRLTSDLALISNTIVMIASFSLRNILMAIGGLVLLLLTSAKLALYVFMILPVIFIPLIMIGRKTRDLSKKNQNDIARCHSHLEETINSIKVVQSYNREKFEYNRFLDLLEQSHITAKKRIRLRSLLFSLVIGLVLFSVALVLWIGGRDVLTGEMSAGELSSFVFYAVLVATSIGGFSEIYSDWQRANGALERIIEISQAKSDVIEDEDAIDLDIKDKINLCIKKLSFAYPGRPDLNVLEDINIDIEDGTTVALVGPSGSGKSSILQLLMRFYDPTEGVIALDGMDIRKLTLESLRNAFALVPQDAVIFSTSAYNNILYGRVDASKKEVEEAAKAAEIYDFFKSLPDGLETHVGEKGLKLSGGQRQRIAIARAILCNPKILLLDEATSSLDSENEKLVQLALDRLRTKRTTLVVAHRISTIINADKIIVIDKGKFVASGNHKSLLKTNDLYKKLSQDYV